MCVCVGVGGHETRGKEEGGERGSERGKEWKTTYQVEFDVF